METIKNWILKQKFVQDAFVQYRDRAINEERPRIFSLAQKDILETLANDTDKQAELLAQKKLKDLLSLIDEKDVISIRGKQVLIGGEQLNDSQLANLRSEVEFLKASHIWTILNETPKKLAEQAMFVDDGKIENQLLKGRAILYTLATQKKILETVMALSPSS